METNVGNKGNNNRNIKNETKRYALIDGLNIAFARNDRKARLIDILSTKLSLKDRFDIVEIIIDASARYALDDKKNFDILVGGSKIIMCPAGIDCDDLIWARSKSLVAKGHEVTIVSNDMFPVRRAVIDNLDVSNLAVSIFPDGDIYFLKRNSKNANKNKNSYEPEFPTYLTTMSCSLVPTS